MVINFFAQLIAIADSTSFGIINTIWAAQSNHGYHD